MNSLLNECSLLVDSTGNSARAGVFQHIINYLEKRMNSIVKKKSEKDIKLFRGIMKMKGDCRGLQVDHRIPTDRKKTKD